MKSFLWSGSAFAVIVLMSSSAQARGKGQEHSAAKEQHGAAANAGSPARNNAEHHNNVESHKVNEGHKAVEHRTADVEPNTPAVDATRGNLQNMTSPLKTNHATENPPFTAGWYTTHPNAWQAAHPHADAWAVASLAAAANWLGIPAQAAAAQNAGDNDADGDDATATNDLTPVNPDVVNQDSDDDSTSDAAAAAHLAQSGVGPEAGDGEFLPLGVFALAPVDQKEATAMLQVSISKAGIVRGSYYDLMSDQGHTIQGAVDKNTERVAFTVGAKGKTVFETQLVDLTSSTGELSLHFPDGDASDWTVARFEDIQDNQRKN